MDKSKRERLKRQRLLLLGLAAIPTIPAAVAYGPTIAKTIKKTLGIDRDNDPTGGGGTTGDAVSGTPLAEGGPTGGDAIMVGTALLVLTIVYFAFQRRTHA